MWASSARDTAPVKTPAGSSTFAIRRCRRLQRVRTGRSCHRTRTPTTRPNSGCRRSSRPRGPSLRDTGPTSRAATASIPPNSVAMSRAFCDGPTNSSDDRSASSARMHSGLDTFGSRWAIGVDGRAMSRVGIDRQTSATLRSLPLGSDPPIAAGRDGTASDRGPCARSRLPRSRDFGSPTDEPTSRSTHGATAGCVAPTWWSCRRR